MVLMLRPACSCSGKEVIRGLWDFANTCVIPEFYSDLIANCTHFFTQPFARQRLLDALFFTRL